MSIVGGVLALIVMVRDPPSGLVVLPNPLDLGKVDGGGTARKTFQVTNQGRSAVQLGPIRTSCPCLHLELVQPVVEPAETINVLAVLDLTEEPGFSGDLAIHVRCMQPSGEPAFQLEVVTQVH